MGGTVVPTMRVKLSIWRVEFRSRSHFFRRRFCEIYFNFFLTVFENFLFRHSLRRASKRRGAALYGLPKRGMRKVDGGVFNAAPRLFADVKSIGAINLSSGGYDAARFFQCARMGPCCLLLFSNALFTLSWRNLFVNWPTKLAGANVPAKSTPLNSSFLWFSAN